MNQISLIVGLLIISLNVSYSKSFTCDDLPGTWIGKYGNETSKIHFRKTEDKNIYIVSYDNSYNQTEKSNKVRCFSAKKLFHNKKYQQISLVFEPKYGGKCMGTYNEKLHKLWSGCLSTNSEEVYSGWYSKKK